MRRRVCMFAAMWALLMSASGVTAQQPQAAAQPPATAQALAPLDLTGTWVSIVSEDWRWRMVTPLKGDFAHVPLNAEGRKVAGTWDLARDVAQGEQCRPFGAANIMRMPGRQQISWQDPNTLKIDYDAGTQTRLLYFDKSRAPAGEKTWQGSSVAEWDFVSPGGRGGRGGRGGPDPTRGGSLKVVTTNMRAGYLRKNGVPYSEGATMTEYFDRHTEANGDQWFTVMTIIEDPKYLTQPFVLTTSFKKEPNNAKWRPTPCETSPPGR